MNDENGLKTGIPDGKRNITRELLQEYSIESAAGIQKASSNLPGSTIKEMMEAKMDEQPGYAMVLRL